MKLAIVYDWMDSWGGAERVLLVLAETFPDADWYTLFKDTKRAPWSKDLRTHTSFIHKLPSFMKRNKPLCLPLMPFAIESFNLSSYTHVLSVSSAFSKAVITRPETTHISYVLSPPRYVWSHQDDYGTSNLLLKPYIAHLKKWDAVTAQRADVMITISPEVQKRVKKYYGRDTEVIYPPFNSVYWENLLHKLPTDEKTHYLYVGRLEPYKKVDILVEAFNAMPDIKLIIIGKGTQENRLRRKAKHNTTFLKDVSDKELAMHYAKSRALIMPQREDFGYVALEAQACGCPVIAYDKGGARSTVIDSTTGLLFSQQDERGLRTAIEKFESMKYTISRSFDEFSEETFKKKFITLMK